MNVLVLSQMYPNQENEISGIFVQEQILALKKKGINIKVVSPKQWVPFYFPPLPSRWGRIRDIPLEQNREAVQVYYPRYLSLPRNFLLAGAGSRYFHGIKHKVLELHAAERFDLIHAHAAVPDGYAAMLLAEVLEIPYLVTIHGLDFYQTIHRNQLLKKQVEKVLRKSSRALVVSEVLKNSGEKHLGEHLPLQVVRNGIDPERTLVQPAEIEKKPGERIILSVANLIERKGIQYVLQALNSLRYEFKDLRYIIVGEGPYRIQLENMVQDLGLEDLVEFTGQLDHNQTMRIMAACDVFVLPSWDEAFGIVYIEAMALGKPVLGCQGEGSEDFIEDQKTGFLVKPKNVPSLSLTIAQVLKNPLKGLEIGNNAQKLVLENFTWEKNALKMIEIYLESIRS